MPDDSGGNYSLPDGYLAVTGQKVQPSNHNPPLEDIAAALTNRYSRDGRSPLTGNMNANSFKIFGLSDGVDPTESVNKKQLDTKVSKSGDTMTGPLNLTESDRWRYCYPIGHPFVVYGSLSGSEVPPASLSGAVYIQLTAGLTGEGEYNAGKLTEEQVSGVAPDVSAVAKITFSGSPMDGQIVHLINTEGRIIRPWHTAGAIFGDSIRNVSGAFFANVNGADPLAANGPFYYVNGVLGSSTHGSGSERSKLMGFDLSRSHPTSSEVRMKMIGETTYMRIA